MLTSSVGTYVYSLAMLMLVLGVKPEQETNIFFFFLNYLTVFEVMRYCTPLSDICIIFIAPEIFCIPRYF